MRVCHFTYSFFPLTGGLEEVVHNISVSQLSHDCKVYVFAPFVRGQNNTLDVPYKVLRYSRPSSRRFGLRQLLVPLMWHHFKYRFDVLHCHGVYPSGYVGASFSRLTGVPFLITPHGGDVKTIGNGSIINERITLRIRETLSSVHAITAISSDIRKRILDLGGAPEKVSLISNGIFLNEFGPLTACQEIADIKNHYIFYLGRLEKDKGVDVLIKAFSEINKKHPDIRLKIGGDGKEKNDLKGLADRLEIGHSVDFLGTVRGNLKMQTLREALCLVCPSRREAFGIVNVEAFASGIPVVASRVGGIPDIVIDGFNGLLAEPDTPIDLAEKLDMILRDPVLRRRLATNALKTASHYDWSLKVKEYLNVYENIRSFAAKLPTPCN
jgi:glycogen(starch) synthase